jgi:heptosyltransferase I
VSGESDRSRPVMSPKNLLVVRLGAMGDVIHTLPAVAALREAFPKAKIGWVVEERWSELLCAAGAPRSGAPNPARPLVDFVHLVNTKKWRKSPFSAETRSQMGAARKELKEQNYELALDFQGAVKSGMVAGFAKSTLGAERPRETPARWFYDRRIQTTGTHVVEQYHSLAEAAAGMPLARAKAEFPRDNAAEENVTRMSGADASPFILINPGAGWGAKQWPAERYGEVARALTAEKYRVLVNAGPGEEAIAQATIAASQGTAGAVSCSIGELILGHCILRPHCRFRSWPSSAPPIPCATGRSAPRALCCGMLRAGLHCHIPARPIPGCSRLPQMMSSSPRENC